MTGKSDNNEYICFKESVEIQHKFKTRCSMINMTIASDLLFLKESIYRPWLELRRHFQIFIF